MARGRDPDLDQYVDEPVPPVAPAASRALSAGQSLPPPPQAKRSQPWVIVVAVVGAVAFIVLTILAALAIHGVRRYIVQAKMAEGRAAVAELARGIARCGAEQDELPETSSKVPSDLELVRGKKYQSAPADWDDDAFRCAEFRMTGPQYFQYQWVLKDAQAGSVVAVADFDGDGVPEVWLDLVVDCSGDSCRVADAITEQGS
jgi:hypothetical protein